MSDSLDWKSLLPRAHAQQIYHGSMSFYLAMLGEVRDVWPPEGTVLEYGAAGASEFLRLLHLAFEYGDAVGVLLAADDPAEARAGRCLSARVASLRRLRTARSAQPRSMQPSRRRCWACCPTWRRTPKMSCAVEMGAFYYAVFGWHAAAPRYQMRAERLQGRGVMLHAHTIENAALAFHAAGFEVAVKRLPATCGVVYDPAMTAASGTLAALLEDVHEHKYLFTCLKPREKRT